MFNDTEWWKHGKEQKCLMSAEEVTEHTRQFQEGRWCLCGPLQESTRYRTCQFEPGELWDRVVKLLTKV